MVNQPKNQRNPALGRLLAADHITATALAWCDVAANGHLGDPLRWQGGGSRQTDPDGYRHETPRWKLVGLTRDGIDAAARLEAAA